MSPTGRASERGNGREIAQRSKKLAIAGLRRASPLLAVKPSLLETSAMAASFPIALIERAPPQSVCAGTWELERRDFIFDLFGQLGELLCLRADAGHDHRDIRR
jgi:hypothetical protein